MQKNTSHQNGTFREMKMSYPIDNSIVVISVRFANVYTRRGAELILLIARGGFIYYKWMDEWMTYLSMIVLQTGDILDWRRLSRLEYAFVPRLYSQMYSFSSPDFRTSVAASFTDSVQIVALHPSLEIVNGYSKLLRFRLLATVTYF